MFKGLMVRNDDNAYRCSLEDIENTELSKDDVTIDIKFSTINYKDALAITGKAPVVRSFPMIPGIDFVGVVKESTNPLWKNNDWVILNGWGVGENHWGGMAQKANVKGDWLIKLPDNFKPEDAMAIGTAGYTAMLCIMKLEYHGIKPDDGPVLVTGASGGVGSVAVSILSKLGYNVTASTGKIEETAYLKNLGANEIINRSELNQSSKLLLKERWIAAIDTVGSHTLANVCASLKYGGVVAACGLAQGMDLPTSVAPFILRGVTLAGVDSVYCPISKRKEAWERLSKDLQIDKLKQIMKFINLEEVSNYAKMMINGKVKGRIVVDVNK